MIIEEKPDMVLGVMLEKTAIKNTLYCIDVAAKAITQLINGEPIQKIGVPDPVYIEKHPLRPTLGEDWMEGQIIFIDNFENVVINITDATRDDDSSKWPHFDVVKSPQDHHYLDTIEQVGTCTKTFFFP
jgi:S-adenosylmethionine hydrolase